ncbi:putative MFS family arabinose efflux permease [Luteococcus japonicus]|uniref:Transporter, putative n=2 Tax=Luteococcus japonicus TaxID=33984 RepID=A0A1R4J2T4_9ACTN|nr:MULTISPECIES: MFS transporter [Luteococcus]MDN5564634.1 MFS transporter [Luteococcus sp.]ROR54033.1 putative MFS family arabinose efflux permease [Luteococcus japonicus]SJN25983.1 transporter, putative [Luteococcus japonicus LSP_Lj1]
MSVAHEAPTGTFASLRVPNYRIFFTGAVVSNVGTWMYRVAQDWLVLTILTDHSSSALGLVTGLQFLPIPFLAPYAGSIADRFPKRRILMLSQSLLGLNALVMFLLVVSGWVELWHVFVLAFLTGVVTAFDNPTRQAFVSEMVPRGLVPNAVGLNSASFNSARLLGPGLAGLMIAAWGVAPAMALNALSFGAVLLSLARMRAAELTPAPMRKNGKGAVREGLRYVWRRPDILVILLMVFMLGTFGMNFQITNALMATKVFGKGPGEYGLLGSIMAIGTLAAALIAARRERPRLRVLLLALGGFALCTGLLGAAPSYTVFAALLVPTGLCALTMMTCANASVQLASDPEVRGRVMALYMAIFMGGTPLGAPLIGWVGDVFGPRWTIWAGSLATGVTFAGVSAWFMVHRGVRVRLRRGWPPRLRVWTVDEVRAAQASAEAD